MCDVAKSDAPKVKVPTAKAAAPKAGAVKLRTVDKRVAGSRARETRERILEALGVLLTSSAYRNVRVTDVVREVGTSPATFYQYFPDVETAVLTLATDVAKDAAQLKSLTAGASWTGKAGVASVTKLVEGIASFWRENEAVLRALEVSAAEGDKRFQKARATLVANLAAPIAAAAGSSKEAKANAAALVALLAYTSADRGDSPATSGELLPAVHRLVHWGITGRKLAG